MMCNVPIHKKRKLCFRKSVDNPSKEVLEDLTKDLILKSLTNRMMDLMFQNKKIPFLSLISPKCARSKYSPIILIHNLCIALF